MYQENPEMTQYSSCQQETIYNRCVISRETVGNIEASGKNDLVWSYFSGPTNSDV